MEAESKATRLKSVELAVHSDKPDEPIGQLIFSNVSLPDDYLPDLDDRHYRDQRLHSEQFHSIGKGGFSTIMAAVLKRRNELTKVALKRFDVSSLIQNHLNGYSMMLSAFQNGMYLTHPNIVTMIDSFFIESPNHDIRYAFMATERMDTTLDYYFSVLAKPDNRGSIRLLDHRHMAAMLVQIFRALDFLQQRGIIHRDILPHNIGMNLKGFVIKLLNFARAGQVNSVGDHTKTVSTPPIYQPLEVILHRRYDCGVDVWATGLVALSMLNCKLMYPKVTGKMDTVKQRVLDVVGVPEDRYVSIFGDDLRNEEIREPILSQELDHALDRLEHDRLTLSKANLKNLLEKIFTVNPQMRPTAAECLDHPYLQPMNQQLPPIQLLENKLEEKNQRDRHLFEDYLRKFSRRF